MCNPRVLEPPVTLLPSEGYRSEDNKGEVIVNRQPALNFKTIDEEYTGCKLTNTLNHFKNDVSQDTYDSFLRVLRIYGNKLYYRGRVYIQEFLDEEGRSPPDIDCYDGSNWRRFWCELRGSMMTLWEAMDNRDFDKRYQGSIAKGSGSAKGKDLMQELNEEYVDLYPDPRALSGIKVLAARILFLDVSHAILGVLRPGSRKYLTPPRYSYVFGMRTRGGNVLFFACPTSFALKCWVLAIRLSQFELRRIGGSLSKAIGASVNTEVRAPKKDEITSEGNILVMCPYKNAWMPCIYAAINKYTLVKEPGNRFFINWFSKKNDKKYDSRSRVLTFRLDKKYSRMPEISISGLSTAFLLKMTENLPVRNFLSSGLYLKNKREIVTLSLTFSRDFQDIIDFSDVVFGSDAKGVTESDARFNFENSGGIKLCEYPFYLLISTFNAQNLVRLYKSLSGKVELDSHDVIKELSEYESSPQIYEDVRHAGSESDISAEDLEINTGFPHVSENPWGLLYLSIYDILSIPLDKLLAQDFRFHEFCDLLEQKRKAFKIDMIRSWNSKNISLQENYRHYETEEIETRLAFNRSSKIVDPETMMTRDIVILSSIPHTHADVGLIHHELSALNSLAYTTPTLSTAPAIYRSSYAHNSKCLPNSCTPSAAKDWVYPHFSQLHADSINADLTKHKSTHPLLQTYLTPPQSMFRTSPDISRQSGAPAPTPDAYVSAKDRQAAAHSRLIRNTSNDWTCKLFQSLDTKQMGCKEGKIRTRKGKFKKEGRGTREGSHSREADNLPNSKGDQTKRRSYEGYERKEERSENAVAGSLLSQKESPGSKSKISHCEEIITKRKIGEEVVQDKKEIKEESVGGGNKEDLGEEMGADEDSEAEGKGKNDEEEIEDDSRRSEHCDKDEASSDDEESGSRSISISGESAETNASSSEGDNDESSSSSSESTEESYDYVYSDPRPVTLLPAQHTHKSPGRGISYYQSQEQDLRYSHPNTHLSLQGPSKYVSSQFTELDPVRNAPRSFTQQNTEGDKLHQSHSSSGLSQCSYLYPPSSTYSSGYPQDHQLQSEITDRPDFNPLFNPGSLIYEAWSKKVAHKGQRRAPGPFVQINPITDQKNFHYVNRKIRTEMEISKKLYSTRSMQGFADISGSALHPFDTVNDHSQKQHVSGRQPQSSGNLLYQRQNLPYNMQRTTSDISFQTRHLNSNNYGPAPSNAPLQQQQLHYKNFQNIPSSSNRYSKYRHSRDT